MTKLTLKFSEFDLNARLLKALAELQFETCTPVQAKVLPIAFEGRDVLVSAETGSGKTVAYLLPILNKITQLASPDTATRCLVLVPTRELAEQIEVECKALCKFTQIHCLSLIGGLSFKEQKAQIRKNPEILIATPGRILEHVQKGSVELGDLETLILDEADRMLDMGFRDDVLEICQACKSDRQTFLLSATLQHSGIERVAETILNKPINIEVGNYRQAENNIKQKILLADTVEHKSQLITKLLQSHDYQKVLIFTNTRDQAKKLDAFLQYKKFATAYLHGELSQDERQTVMQQFRRGKTVILVATDLAARGLDIKGLDLVINFDMARSGDDYLHRIGRTGRAGESGTAISLVNANDWNLSQSIARYLNVEFETIVIKGQEAKFKGKVESRAKKKNQLKNKTNKSSSAPKVKQRLRNKKNVGKRRKPVSNMHVELGNDGLSPLKRK
ncbi:MAG: RNA helicase [SAR86 cluster bacterium]|uniref:RNA helicase n=1 Tax=SAR86 cluster bacterium TaxID=2030880 RepID=A0A2A5CD19_9GAMM|nr:DEAD/DEAH box helicase [Gammaproteobacteria bacterium AH-315-E17]PCJ41774.1 MAG: RNA helicase [SAR86 cluster bacterium]